MHWELRMYGPKSGTFEQFVAEWRQHVLPLRRAHGFEVLGPWRAEDGRFVWIVGHEDLAAADAAYYASPERASLEPDPARHLDSVEHVRMEELL